MQIISVSNSSVYCQKSATIKQFSLQKGAFIFSIASPHVHLSTDDKVLSHACPVVPSFISRCWKKKWRFHPYMIVFQQAAQQEGRDHSTPSCPGLQFWLVISMSFTVSCKFHKINFLQLSWFNTKRINLKMFRLAVMTRMLLNFENKHDSDRIGVEWRLSWSRFLCSVFFMKI